MVYETDLHSDVTAKASECRDDTKYVSIGRMPFHDCSIRNDNDVVFGHRSFENKILFAHFRMKFVCL